MSEIPVLRFPPRYGPAPRLSQVEVRETSAGGQRMFSVKAAGATEDQSIALSPEALAIAHFFDGTRDLRGVQHAIYRQYGELLYVEKIHELARSLDAAGLFEGRRKATPDTDAVTDPGTRIVRPPTHAGTAYETDPDKLRAELGAYFTHPDGPGAEPSVATSRISGIVVPHIDLSRGGPLYAHAYKALAEGTDADLFVIFGTAHASPEPLFTLTRAHYDTPLGVVRTDPLALSILETRLGPRIYEAENVHVDEHSIEFQALYLQYLFGGRRPFTILPILCSTLYPVAARGERPDAEAEFGKFLGALGEAVQGRNVCFIAAADLSHVGTLYGDSTAPTPESLAALEKQDLESMSFVTDGNFDGFFDNVGPDGDTRRICGLTPIYTTMRVTGGARAKLLKYSQWNGTEHGSAVTYAAAVIGGQ